MTDFQFDGYITMNGALLTVNEQTVFSGKIGKEPAREIVRICGENSLPCVAFLSDRVVIGKILCSENGKEGCRTNGNKDTVKLETIVQ